MAAKYPEVRPLGLDALIVRFSGKLDDAANRATLSFAAQARLAGWAGVQEVASALTSILIRFDPLALELEDLIGQVSTLLGTRDWMASELSAGRRHWVIPVSLDPAAGPQLAEAAQLAGRTAQDLATLIASTRVRVLSLGFAPGQPYMGMLHNHWDIPRQDALTPKAPAGALVMAVRQLIIYANAAPTGWRQIGLTGFRPFRPDHTDPITLAPGDEVSFRTVALGDLAGDGDGLGGAVCEAVS